MVRIVTDSSRSLWCLLVFGSVWLGCLLVDGAQTGVYAGVHHERIPTQSRLPRTSAASKSVPAPVFGAHFTRINRTTTTNGGSTSQLPQPPISTAARIREQYLLNVFEAIISTLESKLQRIENLDKAVEHLMRRVESLDDRVTDNIDKTNSVISKLSLLDGKLLQFGSRNSPADRRLISLDHKVAEIDNNLNVLRSQLDQQSSSNTNYVPQDDIINAEASEKKPVTMTMDHGMTMTRVAKELSQLRDTTASSDRKIQFQLNVMSDTLSKVVLLVSSLHNAIVFEEAPNNSGYGNRTGSDGYARRSSTSTTTTSTTTTSLPPTMGRAANKIDALAAQMRPIITVSEKMDEVWNVVVGTKSSVDGLVPKSDELLTQTQRQERAIGEIHQDLRTKTNKIIANLDKVEKRLKKQEDDVATLAQRPVPPELLLDPTIDRYVEYDPHRYVDDYVVTTTVESTPPPLSQPVTFTAYVYGNSTSTQNASMQQQTSATTPVTHATATHTTTTNSDRKSDVKRKGGIIFPSVKNKPILTNTTFASELITTKDVKGYSCVDLLNAGMRTSGVYYLQIRGTTYWFLKVFCEQEIADGGWTVIQRRDDFGDPRENFNRDWNDYKNGFGDPAKEFWLGNENIYMLTNNEEYILRVELEDFEGNKRFAQYGHFKIFSEGEYYKLEIDNYEGNAGDSLNDPWYGSNNSPFSTYNRDNDRSSLNCASMLKGGWWWKSCGRGLNGLYLNDPQDLTARQGIVWFRWRGWDYTLKKATMMIKPKGIVASSSS